MLSFRKKIESCHTKFIWAFLSKGGGEVRSVALLIEFVGLSEKLTKLSEVLSNDLEVWRASLGFLMSII